MINKLLNYLAIHPEWGIIGGVKCFLITVFTTDNLDMVGRVFQNIGYIFGGLLAVVTFFAWVFKRFKQDEAS